MAYEDREYSGLDVIFLELWNIQTKYHRIFLCMYRMVLKIHMHFKKCITHSTIVSNIVKLNCADEVLRSDKLCFVQAQKRIVKESGFQVALFPYEPNAWHISRCVFDSKLFLVCTYALERIYMVFFFNCRNIYQQLQKEKVLIYCNSSNIFVRRIHDIQSYTADRHRDS